MKKIFSKTIFSFLLFAFAQNSSGQHIPSPAPQDPPDRVALKQIDKPKNKNWGVTYLSKYYWRGQWFYGASAGVFLPYISYTKQNLYFYLGGELGENLLFDSAKSNESGFGEVEKDWTGIDYGAVYSTNLKKGSLGLSLGAWYFWYFRSKDIGNDGVDNSFADLRAALTFKEIFLSPSVSYSHYLRADNDYAKRAREDYYITLAINHEKGLGEKALLNLGASVNYWHYASKEESSSYGKKGEIPSGLSDAVLKSAFSIKHKSAAYSASFNYAYVFSDKFDYTSGSDFDQHKFWTVFGIDFAI